PVTGGMNHSRVRYAQRAGVASRPTVDWLAVRLRCRDLRLARGLLARAQLLDNLRMLRGPLATSDASVGARRLRLRRLLRHGRARVRDAAGTRAAGAAIAAM